MSGQGIILPDIFSSKDKRCSISRKEANVQVIAMEIVKDIVRVTVRVNENEIF